MNTSTKKVLVGPWGLEIVGKIDVGRCENKSVF